MITLTLYWMILHWGSFLGLWSVGCANTVDPINIAFCLILDFAVAVLGTLIYQANKESQAQRGRR